MRLIIAVNWSNEIGSLLLKHSDISSLVILWAISPAPGLQKQPVRSEIFSAVGTQALQRGTGIWLHDLLISVGMCLDK